MDTIKAQEELEAPSSRRLGMVALEDLMVRAGYSREAAHKCAMDRAWNRLTAGEVI